MFEYSLNNLFDSIIHLNTHTRASVRELNDEIAKKKKRKKDREKTAEKNAAIRTHFRFDLRNTYCCCGLGLMCRPIGSRGTIIYCAFGE